MEFGLDATTRTAVLVEGTSDKVAVEVLAAKRGRDFRLEGVTVVALGGVTNVGNFLTLFRGYDLRCVGLCDARERRYFERALEEYFVCDPDLEGEFIRALGVEGVERVVAELGDLPALRVFQNQPFQRERAPEDQLRRFMGTMSGRKAKYAAALAEALDTFPPPLEELLAHV
ncbi:MAG: hypothetical protein JWR04_772 [Rhodoglobus sp.]|nr:hypothetical protein [Rhodoglobus sp.]